MLFSYCTNIHPGESWDDTFRALRAHVPEVSRRVRRTATDPFPVGLRLGAAASADLAADKAHVRKLRAWMEEENLLAYTINGFPYGAFHGTRVKENVFAPDWSTVERDAYTRRLFGLLTEILPENAQGSVSTVPGSFKEFVAAEPGRRPVILAALRRMAEHLDELSASHGLDLHLGLEPEPLGLLEDRADTLGFFDQLTDGLDGEARARVLRRIGICYDACHFAIAYEDAAATLDAFLAAGLRLSKVHLSNAPSLDPRDPRARGLIQSFAEPTYLHQVAARHPDGNITRFRDLPDALAAGAGSASEWRVHFHIPLYAAPAEPLGSTIGHVHDIAAWLRRHPNACRHFEMETYTFAVLPEPLRQTSVADMLAAEYQWCDAHVFGNQQG